MWSECNPTIIIVTFFAKDQLRYFSITITIKVNR